MALYSLTLAHLWILSSLKCP